MDTYIQFFPSIIASFIISAFTAWVTVKLSQQQYHSQRWWERKVEAYSLILDSLYKIKHSMEWLLQEEEHERIISDEQRKELNQKEQIGFAELDRLTNMGIFVLSSEINKKVNQFEKELKKVRGIDYYSDLQDYHRIATKYLKEIRKIAIKDLKIVNKY